MSYRKIIADALVEDLGGGDITSRLVLEPRITGKAVIIAKQDLVLSGMDVARHTFFAVDQAIRFEARAYEGDTLKDGDEIARIEGSVASLLAGERVALNFLMRMSGIATLTAEYVRRVAGTKAKISDTRKTAPGLRVIDKMAVRAGGGVNHRMGLFDGILIKDNHIASAGGVTEAVKRAKSGAGHLSRVEVEVTNLGELAEALDAGADAILLDNMDTETMRKAVEQVAGRALIEASGNMDLDRVAEVASIGVDVISVGRLTHSVQAADISMEIVND